MTQHLPVFVTGALADPAPYQGTTLFERMLQTMPLMRGVLSTAGYAPVPEPWSGRIEELPNRPGLVRAGPDIMLSQALFRFCRRRRQLVIYGDLVLLPDGRWNADRLWHVDWDLKNGRIVHLTNRPDTTAILQRYVQRLSRSRQRAGVIA